MKAISLFATFTILFTLVPSLVLAHPGRTAADGCHYCRTNCDYWGEDWNVRHCHNGGGYTSEPVITQPSCPQYSTYSTLTKSCACWAGYCPSLNHQYCVNKPTNSYCADTAADVWLCNPGYSEIGNVCIQMTVIEDTKKTTHPPSQSLNISSVDKQPDTSSESNQDAAIGVITIAGMSYLIYRGSKSNNNN